MISPHISSKYSFYIKENRLENKRSIRNRLVPVRRYQQPMIQSGCYLRTCLRHLHRCMDPILFLLNVRCVCPTPGESGILCDIISCDIISCDIISYEVIMTSEKDFQLSSFYRLGFQHLTFIHLSHPPVMKTLSSNG